MYGVHQPRSCRLLFDGPVITQTSSSSVTPTLGTHSILTGTVLPFKRLLGVASSTNTAESSVVIELSVHVAVLTHSRSMATWYCRPLHQPSDWTTSDSSSRGSCQICYSTCSSACDGGFHKWSGQSRLGILSETQTATCSSRDV